MADPVDELRDDMEERFAGLMKTGVVQSVPSAGRANVLIGDSTMSLPCIASYTPAVNHVVKVCCLDPDAWFVLGRSI